MPLLCAAHRLPATACPLGHPVQHRVQPASDAQRRCPSLPACPRPHRGCPRRGPSALRSLTTGMVTQACKAPGSLSLTPPRQRALPAAPSRHLHIGISQPCAPRLAPRCCSDDDLGGVLHVWGLWAETPTLGSQLASSGPMGVGSWLASYFGWECHLVGISAQ